MAAFKFLRCLCGKMHTATGCNPSSVCNCGRLVYQGDPIL